MVRWLVLVLLVGCKPSPPSGIPCAEGDVCPSGLTCENGLCGGGGSNPDGPGGDTGITIDACSSFATQVDTCGITPGNSLTLNVDHTYNTNTHELRDENDSVISTTHIQVQGLAGPIDLLLVDNFSVGGNATLIVDGDVPFGVIAFGNITIDGDIDASSGGAGSRDATACGTAAGAAGTTDVDGSSGGSGGALSGAGGAGGTGDANGVPVPGPPGGTKIAIPTGLLGGCPGGSGGGGNGIGGRAGTGGGAIYLVAQGTLTISGVIDAGGAGGGRAHAPSGAGGGGGSGGMIVLEAASAIVSGELAANGGGGGGGANDVIGGDGQDGADGRTDATRAAGGAGAPINEGGNGGTGGAGNGLDGQASVSSPDNGGGGGGGSCGFIAIGSPSIDTANGSVSPSASAWPP